MACGKILGGKYNQNKVYYNQGSQVLYVRLENGKKAKLTARNIKLYKKRQDLSKSDISVYAVQWVDGKRSIVSIPQEWDDVFIESCESIEDNASDEKISTADHTTKNKMPAIFATILFFIVVGIIVTFINNILNSDIDQIDRVDFKNLHESKWEMWDGNEENMPNTNVPIYVVEAVGNANYGYGNIRGIAQNRTLDNFDYIQITFGLYNSNNAKIGTCLTNMSNLSAGETWQFDAYCPAWTEGGNYRVDDVNYF